MTEFTVWAPEASRVRLRLPGAADHEMRAGRGGWWRVEVPGAGPDYSFVLDDDDRALPDPRSAWQPAGVHGPSRIYDHAAFSWTDESWTGRQLPGSVLYELHVGTFTPEGTFDAAIGRLDHLVDLGVDLIELLPVNAFNGEHNWGYDGVCWFAPHEPYGGPDGLKRLVDAAHAKGLGVILDVVYNHFGPSGAYAPMFAPYLAERNTPWGSAVNLDGPHSDGVRRFIADSVLMWLRDYHVDGLRLDAVHAMPDTRATHLLEELAVEVESLSVHLGRPLSLIAESDLNDPRLISPREAGGYGLHAQWNDDAHHALHTLLTGERQGYYGDFGTMECLAEVLTGAFFHTGTWSSFRNRQHGRPVDPRTPGHRFVAYLQNHDQIGNRASGDRLSASLSPALLRVGATLLMTAPFTPMLFMGEEWAAATPWQFFTSHPEPELAAAVVNGRRREFAAHGWPPGDVPDPQDRQTFVRSQLDWAELDKPEHRTMYEFYRRLIALRKSRPELSDPHLFAIDVRHGDRFLVMRRGGCLVAANLADKPQRVTLPGVARRVLLATGEGVTVQRDRIELPAETAAIVAL
ncbi:maltooligosyltrehalose trehalohydrolase [Micromonospora phaseoli]|uniref:Malto-oligosyltrehalose trehalohydrolase n=1 Tax=Micromonospora phaseoli TaxID=1144548 RepID=A0A1H6YNA1_9ACTN|nr:malto-oligosyltrehalose trehalohydrolase [Micromonospora phaseoli]PZW00297.1 maltooligosyltrehalose trehalohydrolase [Micromonospora phaseoli]GIJ76774.1 malto-oligosyltrehalose trehalohydrolase [Micromonospora phaseoli]SEJ42759.1 maltooligosyltrehalose trehalohydrolase [Micromonospora phaseoli]